MKFGTIQKLKFGTSDGSYSVVTDREHYDSQITLTDYEANLIISLFGKENIQVGNVHSNKDLSSKEFRLYPTGQKISLNIVYPKPEKTELRLYISSKAGFKPKGGEIWFMFRKDSEIWIGAMSEPAWRSESSELKNDELDEIYQSSVNDTDAVRIAKLKERDIYSRDRRIALQRMEFAGFKCEIDSSHGLFISRFSKKPYLEAHHLIPIGLQGAFDRPLDIIHNVFCLCPSCHRAIHHAEEPVARMILSSLASKHPVLDVFSLSITELFGLYAVEEIK